MTKLNRAEEAVRRADAVVSMMGYMEEDACEATRDMMETLRVLVDKQGKILIPMFGKDGKIEYLRERRVIESHYTYIHDVLITLYACDEMDEFLKLFYDTILPGYYAGVKINYLPAFKID